MKPSKVTLLLLIFGSLLLLSGFAKTSAHGLEGLIRFPSGAFTNRVQLDAYSLKVNSGQQITEFPLPKKLVSGSGMSSETLPFRTVVLKWFRHAQRKDNFYSKVIPADPKATKAPALELEITQKNDGASQKVWLWQGEVNYSVAQMGPALFALGKVKQGNPGPWVEFQKEGEKITALSKSESGETHKHSFDLKSFPQDLDPRWQLGTQIRLLQWVPQATHRTEYLEAVGKEFGPAIQLELGGGNQNIWLESESPKQVQSKGKVFEFLLTTQIHTLPFSLQLGPSQDQRKALLMIKDGEAISQAVPVSLTESFEIREHRFKRISDSAFQVWTDPGNFLKTLGAIVLLLGILLYVQTVVKAWKPIPTRS